MTEQQKLELAKYLKTARKQLLAHKSVPAKLVADLYEKIQSFEHDYGNFSLNTVDAILSNSNKLADPKALKTEFTKWDELIGPQGLAGLSIIGARSGVGKTAFVLSLARNVAQNDKRVLIVSPDLNAHKLSIRLKRMLAENEMEDFHAFIDILSPNSTTYTNYEIIEILRSYTLLNYPDLIVIDCLQLIGQQGNIQLNQNTIANTVGKLKALSRELEIPIVITSQLNRSVELRGGEKRPELSDLKGSSSIEDFADMVGFLYRPSYYGIEEDEDGNSTTISAELIIAKNNMGPTDSIKLIYIPALARFYDPMNEEQLPLKEYGSFREMFEEVRGGLLSSWDNESGFTEIL